MGSITEFEKLDNFLSPPMKIFKKSISVFFRMFTFFPSFLGLPWPLPRAPTPEIKLVLQLIKKIFVTLMKNT